MSTTHEYPLWCVDNGEPTDEARYKGPYLERAQANKRTEDMRGAHLVRRCRVPELPKNLLQSAFETVVEGVQEKIAEGEVPQNAWGDWGDDLLDVRPGGEEAFIAWARRYLEPKVYICEGDELDDEDRDAAVDAHLTVGARNGRGPNSHPVETSD